MKFLEKLKRISRDNDSLLCVGLDTDIEKIPPFFGKETAPVLAFNRAIVEATADLVCAYKLNTAFYEARGAGGWKGLEETVKLIPPGIITIADGKRGDIGNTAKQYARAFFDSLGFDAVTVNPFLGADSVAPFLEHEDRGVFILALTSNKGARDFQYFSDGRIPLYERIIEKVREWNVRDNCGLVVGATRPQELKRIRGLAPGMPILIPGIGAQGGDLEATVKVGTDKNGELALINVSRSIIYASSGKDFARAARKKAAELRDAINRIRKIK
ncbi:orotidine-5'-phosphate decarboxylase [candidate division KSB1 bacterium]|nr:orotidine-5'-phosphate decarboxylase [candidate division KSB1 bacterium]